MSGWGSVGIAWKTFDSSDICFYNQWIYARAATCGQLLSQQVNPSRSTFIYLPMWYLFFMQSNLGSHTIAVRGTFIWAIYENLHSSYSFPRSCAVVFYRMLPLPMMALRSWSSWKWSTPRPRSWWNWLNFRIRKWEMELHQWWEIWVWWCNIYVI